MSRAVLVIEAKYRSGSSITAKYAFKQGKEVFCIPHNLEEKTGVGTNRLLEIGARLVTSPSKLGENVGIKIIDAVISEEELEKNIICEKNKKEINKSIKLNNQNKKSEVNKLLKNLEKIEPEYKLIYELLAEKPMNVNQIAQKLNMNISILNQELTIMEIRGYIKSLPGNEFTIKEKE